MLSDVFGSGNPTRLSNTSKGPWILCVSRLRVPLNASDFCSDETELRPLICLQAAEKGCLKLKELDFLERSHQNNLPTGKFACTERTVMIFCRHSRAELSRSELAFVTRITSESSTIRIRSVILEPSKENSIALLITKERMGSTLRRSSNSDKS